MNISLRNDEEVKLVEEALRKVVETPVPEADWLGRRKRAIARKLVERIRIAS